MRKTIVLFLILVVSAAIVFADVIPIVKFNPQGMFSNYPLVNTHGEGHLSGFMDNTWYEKYQDVFGRYFEQEGLIDLGIEIVDKNIRAVVDLDVRQTLNSFYQKRYYSNIPFVGNTVNAILDMNFPNLAFGEYENEKLLLSVGRRPIKWGPGNYDGAISDAAPFMDHAWVDFNTNAGSGKLGYNFVLVSFNTEALNKAVPDSEKNIRNKKTLIAHKVSWSNESFNVSIGELNLVYGEYPNLIDISPFGIYHNLFQDNKSNVMLSLSAEKVFTLGEESKLRVFGSFAMDDFDLPGEGENGKPGAIGYGAGIQLHIMDGQERENDGYLLEEKNFSFTNGLNISYEYYFCSPYMYNRDKGPGKFTVPLKMYGSRTVHEANAFFIGFKYGPNSSIHEVRVEYLDDKVSMGVTAGLLTRGDKYDIDSAYGKDAVTAGIVDYDYRYKLYGNKIRTILLSADFDYEIRSGMSAVADFSASFDLAHKKSAFSGAVGLSIDVMNL